MRNSRFTELLHRYLDNQATTEEREELMGMVRTGNNDEAIKDSIQQMLQRSESFDDINEERATKMLKAIFEEHTITPVRPLPNYWKWAMAAAAIVLIGISITWWRYPVVPIAAQVVEQQLPTGRSVFTGVQFVRLPDGSTVLLNEGSELSYHATFGDVERQVVLTGEGYFDVQHDPSKPFKVRTGKVTTTVLGTAFNIKAYPGKEEIEVTVTRGKVQVADEKTTLGIITPNQQITFNTTTSEFVQKNLKAETVTQWKNEHLILDDITVDDAVRQIAVKYNVRISLANKDLGRCSITATFVNGENLQQVLAVVSTVLKGTHKFSEDGSVVIDGPGCK